MKTPLLPGECIVKDGAANLQHGIETVGGRLYLTNQRLIFESHAFNAQTGATVIPIASVLGVQKCWTKFFNLIPTLPNSIAVATSSEKEFRIVVFGRQSWINAIMEQQLSGRPNYEQ